ncbi:MAG: GNAT family N-acetyltransferase [Ornithinimicrobium sp.]
MIRPATEADVPVLLELVAELAQYEREPEAATGTREDYLAALFPAGADPAVFAFVAEVDGTVAGMAIWFRTFSTWTGRHGIWLEDLYVRPAHRGQGLGADLMAELAQECVRRGYPRLEWTVLDWNTAAIEVYTHLGAEAMSEWTTRRLTGRQLNDLAARAR